MLCDLTSGVLPSPNETDGVASVTGRNSRYLSINPEFVNEKNAPNQTEPKLAYYLKPDAKTGRRMFQPAANCPAEEQYRVL
jgi:hypothetical protein